MAPRAIERFDDVHRTYPPGPGRARRASCRPLATRSAGKARIVACRDHTPSRAAPWRST